MAEKFPVTLKQANISRKDTIGDFVKRTFSLKNKNYLEKSHVTQKQTCRGCKKTK